MNLDKAIKNIFGKPILKVDYCDFCNWYFSDADTMADTIDKLIKDGAVSIQCIADRVSYIPMSLVDNKESVEKEDIEYEEIPQVNNKYKIKLIQK